MTRSNSGLAVVSTGRHRSQAESPSASPAVREDATGHSRAGIRVRSGPLHELFRAGDVVQIVAVSRRQLQYWAQTDLIAPSAKTPGGHGRYTFEDLVALKAAKRLIDAGVSVQRIRESIRALRRILPTVEKPLSQLVLVATGDVVLAFNDGTAFDAISGQEWVFEVAEFQREIEAWRKKTAAASTATARSPGRGPSGSKSKT